MTTHIDHGSWTAYQPDEIPQGAPANAMFCKRDNDGMDWYTYVHPQDKFASGSVVFAVRNSDNIVGPATYDATAIFPAGHRVYEIPDYSNSDPQTEFGGQQYDSATGTFSPVESKSPLQHASIENLLENIMVRLAKLEGK